MFIKTGSSCQLFGSVFLLGSWMILKAFFGSSCGNRLFAGLFVHPGDAKEDKKAIVKAVLRSFLETLAILAVVWVVSFLAQWIR